MNYQKWIDEVYESSMKSTYSMIDGFEYAAIRLIFIVLHLTSIGFNARFFNGIGTFKFTDKWVLGGVQVFGALLNLGLSIVFKNNKPYKQLFFLTTSYLFVYGGFRVLYYFPEINFYYYMCACLFFSGLSFLAISVMKHTYSKLEVHIDGVETSVETTKK